MSGFAHARSIAGAAVMAVALFVSGLLTMLTPLPILFVSVVRGRRWGVVTALIAVLAVAVLYVVAVPAGTESALSWLPLPGQGLEVFFPHLFLRVAGIGYFAFYGVVALALAEGAHRRWDLSRWGGAALVAGLGVLGAIAIWTVAVSHLDIFSGVKTFIVTAIQQVASASEAAGTESSQLAYLSDRAEDVARTFAGLLPALVFAMALFAVAINIVVARRVIRTRHAFSHVHNVARFRLSDGVIWGLIASGILFFADQYGLHQGVLATISMNGLLVFGALYFLQGLAVVSYFLQGMRSPLMRTLAYVTMLIFIQTVSLALVVVGVADVWVDFRLRRWRNLHQHQ